jgi:hypothetical protein
VASDIAIFGALFDRSISHIAEASGDARVFDTETIYRLSDVWDNNMYPLVCAATAGWPWQRSRLAGAGLRWMADFGAARRAWMVEMIPSLEDVLPVQEAVTVSCDLAGNVWPRETPVTAATAAVLGGDYDLSGASVDFVRVERAGRRLDATIAVTVGRRYRTEVDASRPAILHIVFRDVADLRFDADDTHGLSIECDQGGVVVGIGVDGTIRAATVDVRPDDPMWHGSNAGRAADVVTPHRAYRQQAVSPAQGSSLSGSARIAAGVLHSAMLEIRMVRYSSTAPNVAVRELCRTFNGAGRDVVTAGVLRGQRREHAFRELVEAWIARGGDIDVRRLVRRAIAHGPVSGETEIWASALAAGASPRRRRAPAAPKAGLVEIRRASFGAPYRNTGSSPDGVTVHMAVPDSDPTKPWRLAGVTIDHAQKFRLLRAAFDSPVQLHDLGGALTVGGGTLFVSAHPSDV